MTTTINRRDGLLALAALLASAGARAQTASPRILVGFLAGGSVDTSARRVAEAWRVRMAGCGYWA